MPTASAMAKEDSNNTVTSVSVDENFKTTDTQIYVLAGIYLGCSLLGPILIAVFVAERMHIGHVLTHRL